MPSTYSTSLGFELPATGEQSGTWGDTVNRNVGTLIEEAIAGVEAVAMADANVTLTSTSGASNQARNAVIVATGANTATRDLIIPAVSKVYIVSNSTSGGQSIRIKTTTGTAVTIANGIHAVVYCDGLDTFSVADSTAGAGGTVSSITVSSPLTGGTITSTGTIGMATVSGLTPGTYGTATAIPTFTVDTYGRVTYASQVSIGGGVGSGTVTQVSTGAGLTGGPITSSGTISLSTTGVSAASYGSSSAIPVLTVDVYGRITGITTTPLSAVTAISNTGAAVTATTTNLTISSAGTVAMTNSGTFSVSGNQTIGGTFTVSGVSTFNGAVTLGSSTLTIPNTLNMGTGSKVLRVGTGTNNQVLVSYSGSVVRGLVYYSSTTIVGSGILGSADSNILQFSGDDSAGTATFTVGTVYKTGGGSFSATSDERLKDIHGTYTKGLSELLELEPIAFNYKDKRSETYIGLSAQKVQKTSFANIVQRKEDGYLAIDPSEITYAIVNALKEINNRLGVLEANG